MSSQSLPELIQEANDLSKCYGEWTTRLSDRIQEFEAMLNQLEGKAEASVEGGRFFLSFKRAGDGWRLFYQLPGNKGPQPLASAPVDVKVDAVQVFQGLLQRLVAHHRARRDGLLSAISTVEALLGRKVA